jgi:uncharacterized protein (TIGR03437 family)
MTTFSRAFVFCCLSLSMALSVLSPPVYAATFGTAVAIGGQAADIALDEPRGVLYIADFTANRIDVMTLSDHTVHTSMNVNPQPGSLSLSPDGQYLVIVHFGNFAAPANSNNALTVIHLADGTRQTFGLNYPPLAVAFGNDGLALIATTSDWDLFDPRTGALVEIETISGVVAKTLPQPLGNFPPNIVAASMNVNADSSVIVGLTDTLQFSYNTINHQVSVVGYTSTPALGPRVVSVSGDGKSYLAGWAFYLCGTGTGCGSIASLGASFINPSGILNVGSHAIDSNSNTVYAQIPTTAAALPTLLIADADNLNIRDTLYLPENLAGKSVLSSDHTVMYSVSASGVMVLPVGTLSSAHRLQATQSDVIFRSSFCSLSKAAQALTIVDAGGGNIPFSISSSTNGVYFSATSGTTPATIQVTIDPTQFANQTGTTVGSITISSFAAINVPQNVRLLVNTTQPDQRGTIIDLPGTLVDLLADPGRDRFYVLRQDNNSIYVFDGNYNQITTLRTGTTPTQMAITMDDNYLIVGHDNAQLAYVYDLNALQKVQTIAMPYGHYPRSIGVSSRAILAASRVSGPAHTIDKIDLTSGIGTTYPSLGVFTNSVNVNTVLQGTPNGTAIMGVMADGNVILYDATVDSFTISRKDFSALSGAYAASSFGQFIVGNVIMNESLVPVGVLGASTAPAAGFSFTATGALLGGPGSNTGIIQRIDPVSLLFEAPTRTAEMPASPPPGFAFTRTLAPLSDGNSIVELTTSGLLALPVAFDAAVAPPQVSQMVNAADLTLPVAPGGLVSLFGTNLSPTNMATSQIPLPTALANSCMSVNGTLLPLLFASPTQINAQLPFNAIGNSSLVLYTPGGISNTFNFTIQPTAPSVFRTANGTATIIRNVDGQYITNNTPIHLNDYLTIYLTGMGGTTPAVAPGAAAPSNPLAVALVQPTITIGGSSIFVLWAGMAPKQVGVYQIDALVPFHGIPTGDNIAFKITQGSASTTILLKVEE